MADRLRLPKLPGGMTIINVVALGLGVGTWFVLALMFPALTRFVRGMQGVRADGTLV